MSRRVSRTLVWSLILLVLVAANGVLLYKRSRYREEAQRLRAGMSESERSRADALEAAEIDRAGLVTQITERQSGLDDALHLGVSADSGFVVLLRGGVRLRVMSAQFGPERRVGVPPDTLWVARTRGMRTVERQLTAADTFPLPTWLWADRKQPLPEVRWAPGWLGDDAIVTSGGTLIYALPTAGPLADSTYVMPGAIRLPVVDLKAIRENVTLGMRVYFF